MPVLHRKNFSGNSDSKESACNAGDLGLIPGLGRSPGEGKGHPLQCSCLENSMDCIVRGVAKSRTQMSTFHLLFAFTTRTHVCTHTHTHARTCIVSYPHIPWTGDRARGHSLGMVWLCSEVMDFSPSESTPVGTPYAVLFVPNSSPI